MYLNNVSNRVEYYVLFFNVYLLETKHQQTCESDLMMWKNFENQFQDFKFPSSKSGQPDQGLVCLE